MVGHALRRRVRRHGRSLSEELVRPSSARGIPCRPGEPGLARHDPARNGKTSRASAVVRRDGPKLLATDVGPSVSPKVEPDNPPRASRALAADDLADRLAFRLGGLVEVGAGSLVEVAPRVRRGAVRWSGCGGRRDKGREQQGWQGQSRNTITSRWSGSGAGRVGLEGVRWEQHYSRSERGNLRWTQRSKSPKHAAT